MNLFNILKNIWLHPFNNKMDKSPFRGIIRFVRWQFSQKIFSFPIFYPITSLVTMRVDKGRGGITGNIYCGLLEFNDMIFDCKVAKSTDIFLDIGANVGVYSCLVGKHGGSECWSFEPIPSTFQILKQNFLINEIKGKLENIGVSSASGELLFSMDDDCTNKIVSKEYEGNTHICFVRSIDSYNITKRDLAIKIDVEGFELGVLEGMLETFENNNIIYIIVENNNPKVADFLNKKGFEQYSYDYSNNDIVDYSSKGPNSIFIKNKILVRQRLQNSSKIYIQNIEI